MRRLDFLPGMRWLEEGRKHVAPFNKVKVFFFPFCIDILGSCVALMVLGFCKCRKLVDLSYLGNGFVPCSNI